MISWRSTYIHPAGLEYSGESTWIIQQDVHILVNLPGFIDQVRDILVNVPGFTQQACDILVDLP